MSFNINVKRARAGWFVMVRTSKKTRLSMIKKRELIFCRLYWHILMSEDMTLSHKQGGNRPISNFDHLQLFPNNLQKIYFYIGIKFPELSNNLYLKKNQKKIKNQSLNAHEKDHPVNWIANYNMVAQLRIFMSWL